MLYSSFSAQSTKGGITDLSISYGLIGQNYQLFSNASPKDLASGSYYAQLSNHDRPSDYSNGPNNEALQLDISFCLPYDDDEWIKSIRIGLAYHFGGSRGGGAVELRRSAHDTLFISDNTYYLDSVFTRSESTIYQLDELRLMCAYQWNSKEQKGMSFQFGPVIYIGTGLKNYLTVVSSEKYYTEVPFPFVQETTSYPTDFEPYSTKYDLAQRWNANLLFLLSLQQSLSNRDGFLNKIAISLDLQAGWTYHYIPELHQSLGTIVEGRLGLRYSL